MATDLHRRFKDRLYSQYARIGKALASPHRLELLELLAQSERTVESLADELQLSIANTPRRRQRRATHWHAPHRRGAPAG
jgi:DNA-binding transcriptional ArsR family regulator